MMWWILWFAVYFPVQAVSLFFAWWVGLLVGCAWGVIVFICWGSFSDAYSSWEKQEFHGDHFFYEWQRCQDSYAAAMAAYNPEWYCKIDMDSFEKYFRINPARYKLYAGYAVCDDGDPNTVLKMVVRRRELWRYYMFRRDYLQNKRMVTVLNLVQGDIDRMREDAEAYLEKARSMLGQDFRSDSDRTGTGGAT